VSKGGVRTDVMGGLRFSGKGGFSGLGKGSKPAYGVKEELEVTPRRRGQRGV